MISILLLYITIAATFPLAKASLDYVSPLLCIGIRMILGGGLLLGMHRARKGAFSIAISHRKLFGAICLFHIVIAYLAEFWALQYLPSSVASLFYSLSPFVTALLVWVLAGEWLSRKQLLGMIIAAVGMLPLLLANGVSESFSSWSGAISLPEIALLISVVSACYGWLLVRKAHQEHGYPLFLINGMSMFLGGGISLLASFIFEGIPTFFCPSGVALSWFDEWCLGLFGCEWGAVIAFSSYIVLQIILANVIFYNWYGVLMRRYSVTFLSLCGFLTPLFAAAIGWGIRSEPLPSGLALAVAGVGLGLSLFYYGGHKKRVTAAQ